MRFLKRDLAEQLIDLIRVEQKELGALQKKYDALKPKCYAKHREAAQIEALANAHEAIYTRASEPIFREFGETLRRERDAKTAERDEILGTLPEEIAALSDRISQRLGIVAGDFTSWASQIANAQIYTEVRGQETAYEVGDQIHIELEYACKRAGEITDPSELLNFVTGWVERIEDLESVRCGLFRLDSVIGKALAISPVS